MKKKFRPLVIALGALILVGAAYLLIVKLIPPPPEEEKPSYNYLELTSYQLKDLDHVDFRFRDGYSYTIQLTHKSENSRTYAVVGKPQFDFDYSSLSSACMSLASMSSSRLLSENEQNLAQYGLDDPFSTVDIVGTDGTSVRIYLGNDAPVGSYSYAMKDGSRDVYLLSNYSAKYLKQKDYSYRKLEFLTLNEETPAEDLRSLSLANHGEEIFAYVYYTYEELQELYPDYSSQLVMTYPFVNQLNDSTLTDNLLQHLVNIRASEVVEDFPKDLAAYGLDKDVTVLRWALSSDQAERELTLSQPTEDGIRYGRVTGVDSIYRFNASLFDFADTFDFTKTLYRNLWMYNIKDLSGFDVTAHGVTHEVRLFDPTKEEEEAGQSFWATIDGKDLREENARRLYIRVLSPSAYDLVDENVTPAEEADWSAVIHFDTGRADETIAFYKINARQYAAYRNGQPTGFYVNLLNLQDIDRALEIIAEGDLIPST